MGEYLKNIPSDFNACSEFIRCRETAKIVADITGNEFTFDKRLNEFYQGTLDELVTRVKNFLKEIESKNYSSILICSHGGVISVLTHLILKGRFEPADLMDFPKPGVLLIIENQKLSQIDFN